MSARRLAGRTTPNRSNPGWIGPSPGLPEFSPEEFARSPPFVDPVAIVFESFTVTDLRARNDIYWSITFSRSFERWSRSVPPRGSSALFGETGRGSPFGHSHFYSLAYDMAGRVLLKGKIQMAHRERSSLCRDRRHARISLVRRDVSRTVNPELTARARSCRRW